METTLYLKDKNSGQVLAQFSLDQQEAAFQEATRWEEMGLEVELVTPTLMQGLTRSLGLNPEEEEIYQDSVTFEMEDHDQSCCNKGPAP